nr:nervana 2 [Hymenolepis microstoma]
MVSCSDKCRNFGLAILNPKEKTFFGRTCRSWTLIFIYFVFFYSILASFWIGMLSVLTYGLISTESPSMTGMQSLLKLNPGLSIVPRINDEATLLQVTTFDSNLKEDYLNFMKEYLSQYPEESSNCDFETGQRKSGTIHESCKFPLSLLGPCADPEKYLTDYSNACFYLKLNKIYGYLPDVEGTKIHVQCGATNAVDRKFLGGAVYYPSVETVNGTLGYFSTVVYPYLNQKDFQTPLLAVAFPNIKRNAVLMISCAVKNLANAEEFRFDIAIDTDKPIALS